MSKGNFATLSEVCQIKPPKKEAKGKLSDTDLVSFVPMKDLGICDQKIPLNEERSLKKVYGGYTYFANNDVLLAKITPCFENGKLGIAKGLTNGIGFGSSEYIVFRTNEHLDPEYLFYFLSQNSFREAGTNVMTGAVGHKRVPKEFIENQEIPLPSLPEQKRTVAILDKAFEGINQAIANAEKNLANARELFESYLNNVFTQKGEGWEEKKLTDILDAQPRNGWSPPAKNHSDTGTPVLTLSSVTGFNFDLSKIKYTSASTKKDAHYWAENGALFISRSNTPKLVGHVAICSGIEKPTIYPDLIMKMKLDSNIANTEFVYFQLRSAKLRTLIMDSATGANPTMKKINQKVVKALPVAIPSIDEQRSIVERLDRIYNESQHLESIYQQKLNNLQELKQSILQKAFSGELTADTIQ